MDCDGKQATASEQNDPVLVLGGTYFQWNFRCSCEACNPTAEISSPSNLDDIFRVVDWDEVPECV